MVKLFNKRLDIIGMIGIIVGCWVRVIVHLEHIN